MNHQTRRSSIVVAEDNVADAEFLSTIVRRSHPDIDITIVPDGEAAIARLLDQSVALPDLLLLDINLPRISGHEVLRRVRSDPRCRHLAVVMLSTSRAQQDVRDALELGANAYVVKPFGVEEATKTLDATIAFWLDACESVDTSSKTPH